MSENSLQYNLILQKTADLLDILEKEGNIEHIRDLGGVAAVRLRQELSALETQIKSHLVQTKRGNKIEKEISVWVRH